MALTIKKPVGDEIETKEEDVLPQDDGIAGADVVEEENKRQLELENAELKGKLSVFQGQPSSTSTHEQIKAKVYSDMNNMDDETFFNIYKMQKYQASAEMLNRESAMTKVEVKTLHAESEAKAELGAKYGSNFYSLKGKIEESLSDLSPEARMDPKRLARHMERQYLALVKEGRPSPKPNSVQGSDNRRKVVTDFDKPNPAADNDNPPKPVETDEIAEVDRALAKNMGLTSEKERKEFAAMEYVPMNLGEGIWFKDPKKGFEKVASTQG